jgi:hypothetical protein
MSTAKKSQELAMTVAYDDGYTIHCINDEERDVYLQTIRNHINTSICVMPNHQLDKMGNVSGFRMSCHDQSGKIDNPNIKIEQHNFEF